MVLVQKWPIFQLFFFRQYRPGKCLLRYSRTKKRLSRLQKEQFEKVQKSDIFSKGLIHGFGPKMADFPTFFWCNIGQEKVFYDILKQKNDFLGYKNNKLKKSKNWHFFKPMVLVQKWPFFQLFFFRQYRPGKCLLRYSRSKERLSKQ